MKTPVAGARQRDAPVGLLHVVHDVGGVHHEHQVLGDDEDRAVRPRLSPFDPDGAVLGHAELARDGRDVEVGELVRVGHRLEVDRAAGDAGHQRDPPRATDQAGSFATSARQRRQRRGRGRTGRPRAFTDSRKRATGSPCFTGTGCAGAGTGSAPRRGARPGWRHGRSRALLRLAGHLAVVEVGEALRRRPRAARAPAARPQPGRTAPGRARPAGRQRANRPPARKQPGPRHGEGGGLHPHALAERDELLLAGLLRAARAAGGAGRSSPGRRRCRSRRGCRRRAGWRGRPGRGAGPSTEPMGPGMG